MPDSKDTSNPIVVGYTQKRSETQLHTVSVWETEKTLGFTRFLADVAYMEKFDFSLTFQLFCGIRSTQPTIP